MQAHWSMLDCPLSLAFIRLHNQWICFQINIYLMITFWCNVKTGRKVVVAPPRQLRSVGRLDQCGAAAGFFAVFPAGNKSPAEHRSGAPDTTAARPFTEYRTKSRLFSETGESLIRRQWVMTSADWEPPDLQSRRLEP